MTGSFIDTQETAGKGPFTFEGIKSTANQEHLQIPVLIGKNDAVGGDCHMLIFVLIGILRPGYICVVLGHNNAKISLFRGKYNYLCQIYANFLDDTKTLFIFASN